MKTVAKTRTRANKDKEIVNDGDKVWVTVSFTANLGNYESLKLEAGYSKTYTTEEPLDLIDEIADEVIENITAKVRVVKKQIIKSNGLSKRR